MSNEIMVNCLEQTPEKSRSIQASLIMALLSVAAIAGAQMIGETVIILMAFLLYFVTILTAKEEAVLPLLLFFLPWSTIMKISPQSFSMASFATIFLFLKILCKKREFHRNAILSVAGMVLISLISKVVHEYDFATSYYMFFFMLIAFSIIYAAVAEKTRFEPCVRFFSLGILSATAVAYFLGMHPGLRQYALLVEGETLTINRLCGFYGDPNFYAAQITVALGGLFLILSAKGKKKALDILLVILVAFCGLISISKSFLLCLLIMLVLWLVFLLTHNFSKLVCAVLLGAMIIPIVLLSGAMNDIIRQYLIRFNIAENAGTLTTGRAKLWAQYIEYLWTHEFDLLFGQGYTNVFVSVQKGSHNTLIQAIYQFGLFGTLFLTGWLFSFPRRLPKTRISFWIGLLWVVACFGMWLGLDMLFFDDFFLVILLFFVGWDFLKEKQICSAKEIQV